MSEASKVGV